MGQAHERRRVGLWALAWGLVLALVPSSARAADRADAAEALLVSPAAAVTLSFAVVALASLVHRFAPRKKKQIRRTVIPLVLYLLCLLVAFALSATGSPVGATWAAGLRSAAELLAIVTAINVAGLGLFELAMPALGMELPTILSDIAVGLAYVIAIMRQLGVDPSSIVATSAVVTAVLALSLQATLGNILGGVALQLDESIKPGDWIQLENGKQGRVREIRWRHTVIETRDWDTIIVPNASLLAANIMILGKREGEPTQHRMWIYFNVDFRFSPTDVMAAVNRALTAAPIEGVAETPPPHCICHDFAKERRDSFAYYAVRYWLTDIARDDPTSSLVRTRIFTALRRANIPLAVPAAQLFMEQDTSERRERKADREADRRRQAVASIEFLKPLRDEERARIAERLVFAPFVAGESITKQGAIAHWLYIVAKGTARVCVTVDSREKTVAMLEAPNFFGEMGLLTGAPRTATVVAETDVDCYRLDRAAFDQVLAGRPAVAKEISELLARRQVELDAAREHLDAAAQSRRIEAEKSRILRTIRDFFGLTKDATIGGG